MTIPRAGANGRPGDPSHIDIRNVASGPASIELRHDFGQLQHRCTDVRISEPEARKGCQLLKAFEADLRTKTNEIDPAGLRNLKNATRNPRNIIYDRFSDQIQNRGAVVNQKHSRNNIGFIEDNIVTACDRSAESAPHNFGGEAADFEMIESNKSTQPSIDSKYNISAIRN